MEEQLRCLYLDSSVDSSTKMSRRCIGDEQSAEQFSCSNNDPSALRDSKNTARINDIMIQRGIIDFNVGEFSHSNQDNRINRDNRAKINVMEGFTNSDNKFYTDNGPGVSSITGNQCPDGYSRNEITGECIQVCRNCVYRDNLKSSDINTADPCFPEGVYDGVTNTGEIKCTCGLSNQYCSDNFVKGFTADGMMFDGQKIIMNSGITDTVSSLFNFDYI
jgi:hypothetical protein